MLRVQVKVFETIFGTYKWLISDICSLQVSDTYNSHQNFQTY